MVIDTSALVAIALGEAARAWLLNALEREDSRVVSTVSMLEFGIVLRARLGPNGAGLAFEL